ncbi:MAG TPA: PRC-barrel domain-containing protein [Ktedonobacterales bacterium]|jgi:uncharacterized protein YrrD|nr:PRC-barrel domain-containing protein [Ktedonobacterales bacterium]
MLADLHFGTPVFASDDERVGTLTRVVMDGPSDKVVSIVVDPGLVESGNLLAPGGWEKPRERVVPFSLVRAAARDGVRLACASDTFKRMPLFDQQHDTSVDTPVDAEGQPHLDPAALLAYASSEFGLGGAPYPAPSATTHVEPPAAGAIAENTPVWRQEPHERIGEVERILLDSATQRVTALVVRRGLLRHHVLLPVAAITAVADDIVHVALSDDELQALTTFTDDH